MADLPVPVVSVQPSAFHLWSTARHHFSVRPAFGFLMLSAADALWSCVVFVCHCRRRTNLTRWPWLQAIVPAFPSSVRIVFLGRHAPSGPSRLFQRRLQVRR